MEGKSETVSAKLTPSERDDLALVAERGGISRSEVLRTHTVEQIQQIAKWLRESNDD